jgi:putative glutamine amidotransferase
LAARRYLPHMSRPLIGICAAVERAHWGPWTDEPAVLVPVSYSNAIQAAGGIPVLLPPDPVSADSPDELLDRIDALIVGGGADIDAAIHGAEPHAETKGTNPARDEFELALASRALEREMPLLGVCRGMQILNVATGGTIDQHLPERVGHERHRPIPGTWTEHEVRLAPGSLAAQAAGSERLSIKSHHHQGIGEIGEGLEATGWATDDEVIEAIESPGGGFTLGVLWHPEEDPGDRVIPALIERVAIG